MKIQKTKLEQIKKLEIICSNKGIDVNALNLLLDSVKSKKLLKRNNYHQQKINDVIEKSL